MTVAQLAVETSEWKPTDSALVEDTTALADLKQGCQSKADEFDAAASSGAEELAVLAKTWNRTSGKAGDVKSFGHGLVQASFPHVAHTSLSSYSDLFNRRITPKVNVRLTQRSWRLAWCLQCMLRPETVTLPSRFDHEGNVLGHRHGDTNSHDEGHLTERG